MNIQKPPCLLTLSIEHEGKEYNLYLHPFGSNEVYFAMQLLNGVDAIEDQQESSAVFCNYAASLIAGWDDAEFFGDEYSKEYADKICNLILNRWLVTAIISRINQSVKPEATSKKD